MLHTLSRLRKAFDDELFVRTARGMEPRDRAVTLSQKVAQMLDDIGKLFKAEEFEPTAISTRPGIPAHEYIAATCLPELIGPIGIK